MNQEESEQNEVDGMKKEADLLSFFSVFTVKPVSLQYTVLVVDYADSRLICLLYPSDAADE